MATPPAVGVWWLCVLIIIRISSAEQQSSEKKKCRREEHAVQKSGHQEEVMFAVTGVLLLLLAIGVLAGGRSRKQRRPARAPTPAVFLAVLYRGAACPPVRRFANPPAEKGFSARCLWSRPSLSLLGEDQRHSAALAPAHDRCLSQAASKLSIEKLTGSPPQKRKSEQGLILRPVLNDGTVLAAAWGRRTGSACPESLVQL